MKQVILFEDYRESVISEFIYSYYTETEVFMSGGNTSLVSKARELKDLYDIVIVYVDVVPNNQNTIYIFDLLMNTVLIENWTNVYIIPIPCIEYYIISSFWSDVIPEKDFVVNKRNYLDINKALTFEKFCKNIAKTTNSKCKQVASRKEAENLKRGRFYLLDCNCRISYDSKSHNDFYLIDKVKTFIECLPILPEVFREENLVAVKEIASETSNVTINELCVWYNRYLEDGIAFEIQ